MPPWPDLCEWVGCTNAHETTVQMGELGLTWDFCDKHAEKRVGETDEARYYDE